MFLPRRSFFALLPAVVLAATGPARALDEGGARAHVAATIEELLTVLRTPGTPESRAPALRRIMETRGNLPLIARFAAGRTWRDMSDEQRTQFIGAYSRFVAVTYARRFDEFSGNPKIDVGRVLDAGRKGMLVETPIARPGQAAVSVEWLISDRSGRTEIIDLVIEGVSMAATQRDEVSKMLADRDGSIDQLIADLGA